MSADEYRLAVLRTQSLPAVFEPLQAFDDAVLEEGAALAAEASGFRFRDYTFEDASRDLQIARSHASVALLRAIDELTWTRLGERAGFYPAGAQEAVAEAIGTFEGGELSVDLYQNVDLYMREQVGYPLPAGVSPSQSAELDVDSFLAELLSAREVSSTPEVVEAVRLVQFAGGSEWQAELARLWALVRAIDEGMVVTIPLESLDALRWALTGIQEVVGFDRFSSLLPSKLLTAPRLPSDRLRQLAEARSALADAAARLQENEVSRSSLRLSRAMDDARRSAEGLIDWKVTEVEQATTRLATGAIGDKLQVPPKEEQRKWRAVGSNDDGVD